jgi:hypothetical protein
VVEGFTFVNGGDGTMNWRAMLLGGALAVGLSLTLVPRASADPPPWAGRWKHHEQRWEGQHRNRDYWNRNRWDGDHWDRWNHSNDGRWYRNGWDRASYRRNDPNYAKMMDRIQYDRAKINEIEPTGRHRKALQWYKDDLQNAQRYVHDNY